MTLRAGSNWTAEREQLLAKLWKEGLSASQVAKRLGGVSRNAVIGKVNRLGLLGRAKPSAPSRPTPAPRPAVPRAVRLPDVRHANNGRVYPQPPVVPLPIPTPVVITNAKPWLERAFGECAFPVSGEGAETFSCCAPVRGEAPYCAAHCEIVYAPATKQATARRLYAAVAKRWAA